MLVQTPTCCKKLLENSLFYHAQSFTKFPQNLHTFFFVRGHRYKGQRQKEEERERETKTEGWKERMKERQRER